jgi:hypothetical protein
MWVLVHKQVQVLLAFREISGPVGSHCHVKLVLGVEGEVEMNKVK